MISSDVVTEARVVCDFDRVFLKVDSAVSEVVVSQANRESLMITGRPDILSRIKTEVRDGQLSVTLGGGWSDKLGRALTTSLTRQWVRCDLTVKDLTCLELAGLVRGRASDLQTDRLAVRLRGASIVSVEALDADLLDVSMRGTCQMEVTGTVREQRVDLEGMGSYDAPHLESLTTTVNIRGSGKATVWATENLDVTTRGLGSVEYHGTPQVKKQASPMASVVRAAGPR